MWLRLLYSFGLTNLSDKQVKKYECKIIGKTLSIKKNSFYVSFLMISISLIAYYIKLISLEALIMISFGGALWPIKIFKWNKKNMTISKKISQFSLIGKIFFIAGILLFIVQGIAVAKYKNTIIQYKNLIFNIYNSSLFLDQKEKNETKYSKEKYKKVITNYNPNEILPQSNEYLINKSEKNKDFFDIQNPKPIQNNEYSTEKQHKRAEDAVRNRELDCLNSIDINTLLFLVRDKIIDNNDKYYYLKNNKFYIYDLIRIIKNEGPVTIKIPQTDMRETISAAAIMVEDIQIHFLKNNSRTIFISEPGCYGIQYVLWTLRRLGDLKIEKIWDKYSKCYASEIKKISTNKQLWNFLDFKKGDVILNIGSFSFSKEFNFFNLYEYLIQPDLNEVKISLKRNGHVISKHFFEKYTPAEKWE